MSWEYQCPIRQAWRNKAGRWDDPPNNFRETWIAARLVESDMRWKHSDGMIHRVILWQPAHWPSYYKLACRDFYVNGGSALTLKGVTCLECLGIGG